MRDFTTNLTILVTGSGNSTKGNIEDNLLEWIFGSNDSRNVKVIVPFTQNIGTGLNNFLLWGQDFFQWDSPEGDPLIAVVEPEGGHKAISHAKETQQVSKGGGFEAALDMLTDAWQDGNEVAVISLFEPNSSDDLHWITEAKKVNLLPVLNLCEGLIDSFEGYRTEESIMIEGAAREKFLKEEAEKDALEQIEKPVAKKASAPRKRAAKKAVAPVVASSLQEAEKPLQDSPVGTVVEVGGTKFTKMGDDPFREPKSGLDRLIDKSVQREEEKKAARPVTKDTPLEGLSVFAPNAWTDPAEDKILVDRKDLADLAKGIELITGAFTRIMQGDK